MRVAGNWLLVTNTRFSTKCEFSNLVHMLRIENLIVTALTIGRVASRFAAKNLKFLLAQEVLTLAWVSKQVLISIHAWY